MAPLIPVLVITGASIVGSTIIGYYTTRGLNKIHDKKPVSGSLARNPM